jgi:hypothetical protein
VSDVDSSRKANAIARKRARDEDHECPRWHCGQHTDALYKCPGCGDLVCAENCHPGTRGEYCYACAEEL